MNNYPTQEDRRRFQLIEIIEESLQDYYHSKSTGFSTEYLLASLESTLKQTKLDLLKQVSHYDFAIYMKAVNGKERSIQICNENIDMGLHSFESVLFVLKHL